MILGLIFFVSFIMFFSMRPFILSVLLLLNSIFFSFFIFWKTGSVWVTFVIVLTFSSGMMILITYVSSMGIFYFGDFFLVWWGYFLPLFFILEFVSVDEFFFDCHFFDFSSSFSVYFVVFILLIFMFLMMENCFLSSIPMQSSF